MPLEGQIHSEVGPIRKKREKKKAAGSPYTTVPLPPCKICSGSATGFHFGVITCEACKAFFRRALIHKQEYKCVKNDDCEIIDKKLGNCSACRLKKCFALGMSKGGVRRGRYSIAIRTKAIVEAKAMAGVDAKPMVSSNDSEYSLSLPLYPTPSPSSSSRSGSSSENFDGLLEISDLDDDLGLTVTVHPARQSKFVPNTELEFLIDALVSCQDAVYPVLKKMFDPQVEEFQFKVWEESVVKKEVFDDLFGQSGTISTEEFQQIFAETGIDLDDRLQAFNEKGRSMEESIAQFVNYAKIIPGFKHLNPKDVSRLLKASHMEFWLLGNYLMLNSKLGVSGMPFNYGNVSTRDQMIKFFDAEYVDELLRFAENLRNLNLSLEEIALLRVIVLTYTDRCNLLEREKIDSLQNKYVECLQYYLEKSSPEPGRRMSQLFDRLLAVRDLSHSNVHVNRKFLSEWSFLMTEYPLWKEMLSYDEV